MTRYAEEFHRYVWSTVSGNVIYVASDGSYWLLAYQGIVETDGIPDSAMRALPSLAEERQCEEIERMIATGTR